MALTDAAIRAADVRDTLYRLKDREGLFLEVRPSGKKVWLHRHRVSGSERTQTLGDYPAISLAVARAKSLEIRHALHSGSDPRTGDSFDIDQSDRFEDVARLWFQAQRPSWDERHAGRVWRRIERDALPYLGDKGIREIRATDILRVLERVERRNALEVSKRLRQALGAVFMFAIASGRAENNPAVGLNVALKKRPAVQHMGTLDVSELTELFRRMNAFNGEERTKLALRLVIHTAVRTNEILNSVPEDVDKNFWIIPADRMKQRRDHVIPLTAPVQRILKRVTELRDSERLITIQANSMIHMLYNLGYRGRQTVHGFRSMFSTAANDSGLWSADAIERCLAHVPDDKVRAAYNRAQFMDERKRLLTWWSKKIETYEDEAALLG